MNRADVHELFHSQFGVADLAQLLRLGVASSTVLARPAARARSNRSCPGCSRSPAPRLSLARTRRWRRQLHCGYRSFLSGTTAAALVRHCERCR